MARASWGGGTATETASWGGGTARRRRRGRAARRRRRGRAEQRDGDDGDGEGAQHGDVEGARHGDGYGEGWDRAVAWRRRFDVGGDGVPAEGEGLYRGTL